ncbi:MAG TPA: hypothetical protein VF746_17445 [Longimicrobium sp.]|jgi:hypothetical protein
MQIRSIRFGLAAVALAVLAAACGDAVAPTDSGDTTPRALMAEPMIDEGGGGDYGGGGGDYGGGGTGGTTTEPFNPPPPIGGVIVPVEYSGKTGESYTCKQKPHARWGFSNDVVRGTILYMTGVVPKSTKINFHVYNAAGQLVKTHLTHHSHDNCVVHHEDEAFSTWDLAPGYYHVYANFWTLPYSNGEYWFSYAIEHGTTYVGPLRIR